MSDRKRFAAPVSPGGTIGILGGGQLGRMLSLAAARLGLRTHIYSDETDAPAYAVAAAHTCASFRDEAALTRFASQCDAITFEFENIPAASVDLVGRIKPTSPGARALEVTQDRFVEKQFISSLGLATPRFAAVETAQAAQSALAGLDDPSGILKTRRLGYDGKGQVRVSSAEEAVRAFETLNCAPCILEAFVDFAFEASIVAARADDGAFESYDPPVNQHEHHILRRSCVPSPLSGPQIAEAKGMARKIADALGYVGVLAVELFVTHDGRLLVNEIAPRVHNSGHWTIDACLVSQFEQHIRAVAGWPLGNPARHSNAIMTNLIGNEAHDWAKLAAEGGAVHLYGKKEARAGRKMGHVTMLSPMSAATGETN